MLSKLGVSLRPVFESQVLSWPEVSWLELLIDNYLMGFCDSKDKIARFAEHYPLAFHSVSLSLGDGIHPRQNHFLFKLRDVVNEFNPEVISDHLCWSSVNGSYLHDLLPIPRTIEQLDKLTEHILFVQDFLGRQIVLENITAYAGFLEDALSEGEFFSTLTERTGCGLLLDLNNLWVNCANWGTDPNQSLLEMPLGSVKQVHVAGGSQVGQLYVDSHSSGVNMDVHQLLSQLCRRCGPLPVCLEWDQDIPSDDEMRDELLKLEYSIQEPICERDPRLAKPLAKSCQVGSIQ